MYLCGPERPLPILSDSNKLFLEYRQPLVRTPKDREDEMKGFNATYRFVTSRYIRNFITEQEIFTSDFHLLINLFIYYSKMQ